MDANTFLLVIFFLSATIHARAGYNATHLSSCLLAADVGNFTYPSWLPPAGQSMGYDQLLNVSIRNLRFTGPTVAKPSAIIVPNTRRQLQRALLCCRRASLVIRVRSGGHSYEGLSYTGEKDKAFALIDLMNLNRVTVNITSATAWVQAGATLGQIYRSVAKSSATLGFPAGSCPTVGSGGHIGGGGFGLLSRKYGLAADNVIDAVLIDADGRALDRGSMGEDVFWAIRGGGGGSWGVVYAWRIRLVPVPGRVTVFSVSRQGTSFAVAKLVHKWQYVGPDLQDEFYLSASIAAKTDGRNVSAAFSGQFLGSRALAVSILSARFPELGLVESDCTETSWIDSVVYFAGVSSVAELEERVVRGSDYFKAKSDYVQTHISVEGFVGALNHLATEPSCYMQFDPYGGAVGRIRGDELPFPHRGGILYGVQYMIVWSAEDDDGHYVNWLRGLYSYMEPLVSTSPRAAYVNYLDLDLGTAASTVDEARAWGEKYFSHNFDRLVRAKTQVDPKNVFSNAQSIPPLSMK